MNKLKIIANIAAVASFFSYAHCAAPLTIEGTVYNCGRIEADSAKTIEGDGQLINVINFDQNASFTKQYNLKVPYLSSNISWKGGASGKITNQCDDLGEFVRETDKSANGSDVTFDLTSPGEDPSNQVEVPGEITLTGAADFKFNPKLTGNIGLNIGNEVEFTGDNSGYDGNIKINDGANVIISDEKALLKNITSQGTLGIDLGNVTLDSNCAWNFSLGGTLTSPHTIILDGGTLTF